MSVAHTEGWLLTLVYVFRTFCVSMSQEHGELIKLFTKERKKFFLVFSTQFVRFLQNLCFFGKNHPIFI